MSTIINGLLLMFAPSKTWQAIADASPSSGSVLFLHTIPFALIPAICWYIGVTQYGWDVAGETMRLTPESALPMCIMFYFACVFGVIFLGFMVQWMSTTYGDSASLSQGITLISYTATPFFVAGLLGLYPVLWIDIVIGLAVACYCIYLLYAGVAPIMKIARERGFLYASAVFAVALVSFVGLLTVTVLLWDFGPAPEYMY
jgi:Yip1-like protein